MTLPEFVETYSEFESGQRDDTHQVSLAGRVMRLAGSGVNLRFYDLVGDDTKVQIFADAQ